MNNHQNGPQEHKTHPGLALPPHAYQSILDLSTDGALILRDEAPYHIIAANEALYRMTGMAAEELIQSDLAVLQQHELFQRLNELLLVYHHHNPVHCHGAVGEHSGRIHADCTLHRFVLDGHSWICCFLRPSNIESGDADRNQNTDLLLHSLFEFNTNLLTVFDSSHKMVRGSATFYSLTGYSPEELEFTSLRNILKPSCVENAVSAYYNAWTGELQSCELVLIARSGYEVVLNSTFAPMKLGTETVGVVIISTDITERKRSEEQIRYLAYYDDLTGLPNRRLFRDQLSQAIAAAEGAGEWVAVMFVDIDRFKLINDSLGLDFGDMLLLQVAERLTRCVSERDMAARIDGDEFVLYVTGVTREQEVFDAANLIFAVLDEPFTLQDHSLHVTVSIGISVFMNNGESAELLMKQADVALSKAKEQGNNNCQIYASSMNIRSVERLNMDSELRRALLYNEFVLYYQPQVDIRDGRIVGAEALIRWNHPVQGMIPPGKFIPLAEENGMIVQIGDWVIREACRQCAAWQNEGVKPFPVSVNLSVRQFLQQNLSGKIKAILEETGLDPQFLELEITETMTMDMEYALGVLNELKSLGVHISIDDFGTGYSSLNYLKKYPVSKLKIDRSFVRDVMDDPSDAAIVATIISMAHNLSMKVIAEGVETPEQLAYLKSQSCNEVQGFLFSPPIPAQEIERMVRFQQQAAAADQTEE